MTDRQALKKIYRLFTGKPRALPKLCANIASIASVQLKQPMPYKWDRKPSAQKRRTGYRKDSEAHRKARLKVPKARRVAIALKGAIAAAKKRQKKKLDAARAAAKERIAAKAAAKKARAAKRASGSKLKEAKKP